MRRSLSLSDGDMMEFNDIITLDYGSGGKKTAQLIEELLLPELNNSELSKLADGAVLNISGNVVFSTDSFVVSPLFFPGGNIGKLAVCGTVNDISMCGGTPEFLSLSFIIEEGFDVESLKRIVTSISESAREAGVLVVTGDTKVVERGRGDGIYINTSGIGRLTFPGLSRENIEPGDKVIVSGTIGDHGTAVMLSRDDFLIGSEVRSDCMPLNKIAAAALSQGGVRVLRDPTRGGVATTLCEFVEGTQHGIELYEKSLPVRDSVRAACDMLGLDPMYSANEGKMLSVVDAGMAETVLKAIRGTRGGEDAAIIGEVTDGYPGKVVLRTYSGGGRVLSKLSGAQLPRIC